MFGWFKKRKKAEVGFREFIPGHPFVRPTGVNDIESELTAIATLRVATVYACVRAIAQALGTLPIVLVKRDGAGEHGVPVKSGLRATAQLVRIMREPNPRMSAIDFKVASTAALALHGNALIQIRRNRAGAPVELNPIHPSLINYNTDIFGLSNQWSLGQDSIIEPEPTYTINGQSEPLEADEVIHLRGVGFDGIYGAPMTTIGSAAISIAQAIDRNAGRFYANNAPRLIWELPEGRRLSDESYRRLEESLQQAYVGHQNAYKPIVGDAGAKVKFASFSAEQAETNETRIAQQLEICRLFGVPPARIGILTAQPRANVEQENLAFVSQTISFYAKVWAEALERTILSEQQRGRGLGFEIPTRSLTMGALTDRAQAYRTLGELGCLTKNEVRRDVLGLPPIPNGDEIALPPNMAPELMEREQQNENEDEGEPESSDETDAEEG